MSASGLRDGVIVSTLPAGGLIQLTATGMAPATSQTLEFASSIGAPSGAPDPFPPNNAAAISRTVVKSAPQCSVAVSPDTMTALAGGGSVDVTVDAPAGCAWTATSDDAWASASPGADSGPSTFTVTVAANFVSTTRQAGVVVQSTSGQSVTFPVRQLAAAGAAVPCSGLKLTRQGEQIGGNRVTNFVEVQAPTSDCTWAALSDASWITLTAASQQGSGQVEYEVQANEGSVERRGTLKIGDAVFTVVQAPLASTQFASDGGGGGDSGGDGGGSGGSGAGG